MSAYTRILLRYLAGYLVLKAVIPADLGTAIASDPDLAIAMEAAVGAGAAAAAAVEEWYSLGTCPRYVGRCLRVWMGCYQEDQGMKGAPVKYISVAIT
jgi:hypothetical protein